MSSDMLRISGRLIFVAVALFLACGLASSETIYSDFAAQGPDGTGGGYTLGGSLSPLPGSGFYGVAVPFVPGRSYSLDSISIPISGSPNLQITIELRDGATSPQNLLETYSASASGFVVLNLLSNLHTVLQAGQQYWVVVTVTAGSGQWGWGGVVHPTGTVLVRATQSSDWSAMSAPSSVPGLYVSGTPLSAAAVPALSISAMVLLATLLAAIACVGPMGPSRRPRVSMEQ